MENAFARLKHFCGLATRYDELKRNYESVIAVVCGFMVADVIKRRQILTNTNRPVRTFAAQRRWGCSFRNSKAPSCAAWRTMIQQPALADSGM